MNAGINPNNGFFLYDEITTQGDETPDETVQRGEYLARFRERAVSEITGLIEGCHIRIWRALPDGTSVVAMPLWAGSIVFVESRDIDSLYFEKGDWEALLESRHPETDLANPDQTPLATSKAEAILDRCEIDFDEVRAFLVDLYATAGGRVDWKRVAYPAARGRFGAKLKRTAVEAELRQLCLIGQQGRPNIAN